MRRALLVGALTAALPWMASSLRAQTAMGTAFTYQGRLANGGSPVSGPVDLKFSLFDVPTGGNALASTTVPAVQVTSGLFTVSLDFGSSPFSTGQARWLEVQVSPPGGPVLSPRQELTPSPYSLFSSYTDPAHLTNLNAANITSGTVPSAALGGGYSNAMTLSSPGNVFVGDGSGLTNLNAQAKYVRTVVVGPVGVGTPTANGTALLAALAGITTATATEHWLLKIEPGLYDVGTSSLVMKPFVDVEGSGELDTRIRGSGHPGNNMGTVQAVTSSELRFVTVENTGGDAYAKALYISNASPRITHVTAIASGGTTESQGVHTEFASSPIITDVIAFASATGGAISNAVIDAASTSQIFHVQATGNGGSFARGFNICCGAAPTVRDSVGTGLGATVENHGMAVYGSSPNIERVTGNATGGAVNNLGILINGAASPVVRDVVGHAVGATSINWGVLANGGAQPNASGVAADASGGTVARGLEYDSLGAGASLSHVRAGGSNGSSESTGLKIINCGPRVADVDAFANGSGSNVIALYLRDSGSEVSRVTASAGGTSSGSTFGVRTRSASEAPTLTHVTATATTGGSGSAFGLSTNNGLVIVDDAFLSAASPFQAVAVFTVGGAALTNVTGTSSGAGGNTAGFIQDPTVVRLANVKLQVTSSGGFADAVQVVGTAGTVTVDRSTLTGATRSVSVSNASTVHVAESQLEGPATNTGGGTLTCLRAYDATYTNLTTACQ